MPALLLKCHRASECSSAAAPPAGGPVARRHTSLCGVVPRSLVDYSCSTMKLWTGWEFIWRICVPLGPTWGSETPPNVVDTGGVYPPICGSATGCCNHRPAGRLAGVPEPTLPTATLQGSYGGTYPEGDGASTASASPTHTPSPPPSS